MMMNYCNQSRLRRLSARLRRECLDDAAKRSVRCSQHGGDGEFLPFALALTFDFGKDTHLRKMSQEQREDDPPHK